MGTSHPSVWHESLFTSTSTEAVPVGEEVASVLSDPEFRRMLWRLAKWPKLRMPLTESW